MRAPSVLLDKNRVCQGDEIHLSYTHDLLKHKPVNRMVYTRLVCVENVQIAVSGRQDGKFGTVRWESGTRSVNIPDGSRVVEFTQTFQIPENANVSRINPRPDVVFSETIWYVQVRELEAKSKMFYEFIIIVEQRDTKSLAVNGQQGE